MEVELFIHGVPNGEGFWGKEEDRNYFGNFYDNCTDEVKYLIQTRALNGKSYCYYNYLVYKSVGAQSPNVVAYDGRDGSYFGITLRLDAYCKDIINMYRILDTVYNVFVVGKLLKMEKSKLKYTTPDFASVSNILENIEKESIQLIQNAFSIDDFTRLDGFAMNGGTYPSYNLYDCTSENVMSSLKHYGRVAISPYYSSSKEDAIQKQYDAQIQTIQQRFDSRLKADADACAKEKSVLNASLSSVRTKVSQLLQEIDQKDRTICQLRDEVSRLQSEYRSSAQNKKISQIVAPIREPVIELAAILKKLLPNSPEHKKNNNGEISRTNKKVDSILLSVRSFIPYVNFILLLLIFCSLLFKCKPANEPKDTLQKQIELLEEKNKALQEQIKAYSASGNGIEDDPSQYHTFNIDNVKIDIKNFNGGDLKKESTYDVEAINGASDAKWEGEGCEIILTDNPTKIQISPTADKVKIKYCVGNEKKERVLNAK